MNYIISYSDMQTFTQESSN